MNIAALIAWLLTAAGGFFMLGTWIARGGLRQQQTGATRFPAALIFGHFALAAVGLVVWIIYLFAETTGLAWTAFVLLIPVALLGFLMLFRWIPTYRARAVAATGGPGTEAAADQVPAERHLPVAVVAGHGLLAVVTLVLVLLASLGAGS
jgi:hypothetical protein